MKNRLSFLLLATCFAAMPLLAQSPYHYGIKAGVNICWLPGKYPSGEEKFARIGYHGGFTLRYDANTKWSVLSELLVSAQGAKTTDRLPPYEKFNQEVKSTYINLPVMAQYHIIKELSFEAGIQVGVLVSAKNVLEYTNSFDPSQDDSITLDLLNGGTFVADGEAYSYKKTANAVDFGFVAGLSYTINSHFYLQARFDQSVSRFDTKDDDAQQTSAKSLRNSVLQFSVGFMF